MNPHLSGIILASSAISFSLTAAYGQQIYSGICDASAAVAVDPAHFLVAHDEVFEDEGDTLFLYRNDGFAPVDKQNQPIKRYSFKNELQIHDDREGDIEGAAKIDDRVFWITSHGRNRKGKIRKNRYNLFATDLSGASSETGLQFSGAYTKLANDMQKPENFRSPVSESTLKTIETLKTSLRLDEEKVKSLRPKKNGMNIEALAALPDKSGLLIGLRNPVPNGKAIVIPLLNPNELVSGKANAAKFGQPISMDLEGRGVRAMEYVPGIDAFLIVAGPVDDESSFMLYKWSGTPEARLNKIGELDRSVGSNPEALIVYEGGQRVQILYDEGSKKIGGADCKDVTRNQKSFSDRWYFVD